MEKDAPMRSLSAVGKRVTFGFCLLLPLPFTSNNALGGRILRQTVCVVRPDEDPEQVS